jgi:hypothetical protein
MITVSPTFQTDLGAGDRPVISQGVRRNAVADVDGHLIGDDGRLEDVRIGVGRSRSTGTTYGLTPEVASAGSAEKWRAKRADNRENKRGENCEMPELVPNETCHEDLPVQAVR